MTKFAYIALFAASLTTAPAMAQDAPVAAQDDVSQFSPAHQFATGMFMLSKVFVDIISAPETEQNPDAAAEKIDELTEFANKLYEMAPQVDKAELQQIQSILLVSPEYNDIQMRGAAAGTRLKSTDYFGSEKLKTAVQKFFFAVFRLSAAN